MKHLLPLFLALLLAASGSHAAPAAKPNFVVINIDDLGYAELGSYGATKQKTPHLDRLAKEGRRLTSHYAAPVCSPSRASLMTGSYPKRALPIPGVLFPAAAVGLNPAEVTVAEVLRDAGYATGMVGKWHLGDQPEFLPTRQGFQYFFGLPYSNDMGPVEDGMKSDLGKPRPTPKKAAAKKAADPADADTGIKGMEQPPLPLLEGERVIGRIREPEHVKLTGRYTEKAVEFIRAHRGEPFFLYLAHNAVHFPRYPDEPFRGRSQNGLLGDWIEEMDASVGRVVDTLRELKLAEKTLVIFTSDNGGPVQQGATNTPLRAGKGTTWEGGMRVCTLAWWPGRIPAGTATGEITSMMDILPTFARLAGGRLPADRKLDGHDIWPVLAGTPGAGSGYEAFYYYRGFKLEAVRSGPWKLVLDGRQLFQLESDLGESRDVAAENPAEVARLLALAERMKDDLGLDGVGPGCRPLGRVAGPKPLWREQP
jgi:arylsulfatase A